MWLHLIINTHFSLEETIKNILDLHKLVLSLYFVTKIKNVVTIVHFNQKIYDSQEYQPPTIEFQAQKA